MEIRRHHVPTPDGRTLDVVDAGAVGDPAIVVHSGTPSAHTFYGNHLADAERRDARLVSYARPGYLSSTRAPGRTVADAATDVATVTDFLGVERFATWGISGGGPHALACAALLPTRVVAAASLASIAPWRAEGLDFLGGMGEDNVVEFTAAMSGEDELRPLLETFRQGMLGEDEGALVEQMRTLLSPVDAAVFTDALGVEVARSLRDGVASGIDGWLDDDLAFARPWGFDLTAISGPVQLWQGEQDLMVPFAHGRWLAAHIPGVDAHLSSEEGHLTLLSTRVPAVHEWLLGHF